MWHGYLAEELTCFWFKFLEAISTLPDEVFSKLLCVRRTIFWYPSQVALVWPRRWSAIKFLFIANKYMALGDALFEAAGKMARMSYMKPGDLILSPGYSRFIRLSNVSWSCVFIWIISNHHSCFIFKDKCSILFQVYCCECPTQLSSMTYLWMI